MAFYLLDTNVASWLLDAQHKRHPDVVSFVNQAGGDSRIYISRITIAEIQYGYKVHSNVDLVRKQAIEQRLKLFQPREIDRHTTEPYSDIRASYSRSLQVMPKKGRFLPRGLKSLSSELPEESLASRKMIYGLQPSLFSAIWFWSRKTK